MPAVEIDVIAARRHLEQVLASPGFSRNERMARFLRFVVERHLEGKDSELKESVIAIEVFGRKPDYDPKQDSIVRTEAARLRARLVEYYAGEGNGDSVVIELPKGGYIPVLRIEASQPVRKGPWLKRHWPKAALATGLVVVAAGASWRWLTPAPTTIPIAVLPLENLGGGPDNDFADGLTDEIISNLSVIEGLAVRSRNSSFAFKGKPRDVREAGRQLGADYLLEGSVRRAGEKLRVITQLVRVRDDSALWSGTFDRELIDIFAIQDEISRAVVNQLRLNLGRGKRRYEANLEAYDIYLRALQMPLPGQGGPDPAEAIELFQKVIDKDPTFAPAYAGIARAYAYRSVYFPYAHPAEELDDELKTMRAAAQKAKDLDPLLAETFDALGMADARDGHWKSAETNFLRAIELNPNRSDIYMDYYFSLLKVLGRHGEAVKQLRIAQKNDPLSIRVQTMLANTLLTDHRYDEAAELCLKIPGDGEVKHQDLARARLGQGRIDEAIQILLSSVAAQPENAQFRGLLGYAYARAGRREDAEKMAAAPKTTANEKALIFAGLKDKERSLEALDGMAALGAQRVGTYLDYPEFDLLRGDPRVKALRQKVGLPE